MILIDKYELIKELSKRKYSRASLQLIMDQPEVKAITIEWLEKYMEQFRTDLVVSGEYILLHSMLTEWETENE